MSLKRPIGIVLALTLGYFVVKGIINAPDTPIAEPASPVYPSSEANYAELDSEVGCNSKYSDEKKEDVFSDRYKNHWMTWEGKVVLIDADQVSINLDDGPIQDLTVYFQKKGAGYDLTKGSVVKVRFLMSSMGGCLLAFRGEQGELL